MLNTVRTPISRRAAITCFIAVWRSGAYRKPIPTSSTQRATFCGGRSRLMPSVSTTSAEPQSEDTERLPCLATRSPDPATTNAVAVDTLKVPVASPPVPQVSISISRSVPVRPATSSPRVRMRTTFWRITCAKPISSSTISPFIRSAVRNAAICAWVAAPDMIASIAAAASMRVRSRRSTRTRIASLMIGLVMADGSPLARASTVSHRSPPWGRSWGGTGSATRCRSSPRRHRRDVRTRRGRSSETEIRLLHVGARPQALPRPLEHDPPVLEHVASVREPERARHVLLDEHDRRAVAIDTLQSVEDELHRHRRQPEARLVQQEEPRAGHEPAPDRAHLLLAARQRPGQLPLALAQAGEEREDKLERVVPPPPVRGAPAELEIVSDRHRGKELAPLRHVGDAPRDDLGRSETIEPRALEFDAPGAHGQKPADRPQRRGLAGAVRADQRHRLAPSHLERDAGDRRQVAVAGLEPVKPEQRGHTRRPGRPRPLSGDWRCRPGLPPRSSRRSSARRSDGTAPSPPACCARSTEWTPPTHGCRGSAG